MLGENYQDNYKVAENIRNISHVYYVWCGTILYSVNYVLNKRRLASSQAGSIGRTMRTGEFWEGGSFFPSPVPRNEEAGCDLPQ